MGASTLWRRRRQIFPRLALAAAVVATIAWAFVILGWSPTGTRRCAGSSWSSGSWPRSASPSCPGPGACWPVGLAGFGIASVIAAPAAYSLDTAATPHSGAIPSAGPPIQSGGGFGGPGGFGGRAASAGVGASAIARNGITLPTGLHPAQRGTRLPHGLTIPGSVSGTARAAAAGRRPASAAARRPAGFGGGPGARRLRWRGASRRRRPVAARPEACSTRSTPGTQLAALLAADASHYSWVAATTGSNSAAGYQLATGDPVMAIGGFNGTDPAPTLAQFEKYVAEGRIHYYIGGGGGFGGGGGLGGRWHLGQLVGFADRLVGDQPLHGPDRRRGHRLRPDHRVIAGPRLSRRAGPRSRPVGHDGEGASIPTARPQPNASTRRPQWRST